MSCHLYLILANYYEKQVIKVSPAHIRAVLLTLYSTYPKVLFHLLFANRQSAGDAKGYQINEHCTKHHYSIARYSYIICFQQDIQMTMAPPPVRFCPGGNWTIGDRLTGAGYVMNWFGLAFSVERWLCNNVFRLLIIRSNNQIAGYSYIAVWLNEKSCKRLKKPIKTKKTKVITNIMKCI